jgi:hypothetical protein
LSQREIEQIANYFYAHQLAADEDERREGGSEELFQAVAKHPIKAIRAQRYGVSYST